MKTHNLLGDFLNDCSDTMNNRFVLSLFEDDAMRDFTKWFTISMKSEIYLCLVSWLWDDDFL